MECGPEAPLPRLPPRLSSRVLKRMVSRGLGALRQSARGGPSPRGATRGTTPDGPHSAGRSRLGRLRKKSRKLSSHM
eukprot:7609326-Alexandrium_andersonii.AAC.1